MILNSKRLLAILCMVVISHTMTKAIPAYPGVIQTTQPDGTVIEIVLQGDEHCNWATTTDGYTLLRNEENYWTLACQDNEGRLVASKHIFRNNSEIASALGIERGLRFTDQQLAETKGQSLDRKNKKDSDLQVDGTFPSTGQNKLLLLMVNFSNTETTYTQEDFEKLMNEENYKGIGSFRDFYLENSYGQLDITTVVTRWVTLPYTKEYYGSERAIEIIQNGLNIINDEINLADFDNDGDGILDGLAVIHQGTGQEASGNTNEIWSHSSTIYGMSFDGIQVRRYTIEPELLNSYGDMTNIGVICHEFGHNLGAPDFYDSDYYESGGNYPGTGVWDLMASGAWNGVDGDRPAGINMWQKIQCGWVTPTLLEDNTSVVEMQPAHSHPVAYRFDTTVPSEYFILENRQQAGRFDTALPGHGLLVYHANDAMIKASVDNNTVNSSYPQAMYLVSAGASEEPSQYSSSYGNVDGPSTPFPGASKKTTFSDTTIPSTRSISGRNSYKSLNNIQESAEGLISFDFTNAGAPTAPINLVARNEKGAVYLSWEMPQGVNGVVSFNVYRDQILLANTKAYEYIDTNLSNAEYVTYYVDAVYSNGLVSPYVETSTRVPVNFVTDIETVVRDNEVELNWKIESRLTRMTDIQAEYTFLDYEVSTLDYVHRFRVEDLQLYKGYKIKKIAYLPYQAQKDMTITLRVWEAEPGGENPTIVSERVVKEYGTAVWNTTLLTKSVEITGEKELWIGLHCQSTTGSIRLITDQGPVIDGYGNWVRMGNEEWEADKFVAGNFFLYAPLSEPEMGDVNEIFDSGSLLNPYLDMLFPTGYAIYRDEQLLAWTDSRKYVDKSPLSGLHTYSIASLYRGNNESIAIPIEVIYNGSKVVDVNNEKAIQAVVKDGAIVLPAYEGNLLITDMMGRIVRNGYYTGDEHIALQEGVYILQAGDYVDKVMVR